MTKINNYIDYYIVQGFKGYESAPAIESDHLDNLSDAFDLQLQYLRKGYIYICVLAVTVTNDVILLK